ncbi:MAG: hypothetical protein J0G32_00120 [Alphaproteobacteria bacterium]|nr:hypothetical protein [Alphaproteobacteria bacterium]OJV14072.1 MAG: hypothetical protein BGO27_01120 [Alphaproteobacteria bacterium 33-17]
MPSSHTYHIFVRETFSETDQRIEVIEQNTGFNLILETAVENLEGAIDYAADDYSNPLEAAINIIYDNFDKSRAKFTMDFNSEVLLCQASRIDKDVIEAIVEIQENISDLKYNYKYTPISNGDTDGIAEWEFVI